MPGKWTTTPEGPLRVRYLVLQVLNASVYRYEVGDNGVILYLRLFEVRQPPLRYFYFSLPTCGAIYPDNFDDIVFYCTLKGTKDISLRHKRSGKVRLTIHDACQGDTGFYACIAHTHLGEAVTAANIEVEDELCTPSEDMKSTKKVSKPWYKKPVFIRTLQNQTCKDGGRVTMDCTVKAFPAPQITWYKDGKHITQSNEFQLSYAGSVAKLVIVEAFPEDEGKYTCKAVNTCGEISTSCALMVEDLYEDQYTPVPSSDASREPEPSPQYNKKGFLSQEIWCDMGNPSVIVTPIADASSTREIHVEASEEGNEDNEKSLEENGMSGCIHKCGVKPDIQLNGATGIETNNKMASLKADRPRRYIRESKPSFIIRPRRQFVDEGLTAKFKATFDGEPTPTLHWERDGKEIKDGGRYKLTCKNDFYFLEIEDVTMEDKGSFTCVITNSLGSEKVSAELEVYAKPQPRSWRKKPPKVEEPLKDKTVTDGDPLTMECSITGTPEPTISWYHDNKLVKTSEDIKQVYNGRVAKLVFGEVFPEDDGAYECKATNENGDIKTTCRLTVKEAKPVAIVPKFSRELKSQSVLDGQKVTFQCSVVGTPPPVVTWYKSSKELKASSDFKISFDGTVAQLDIMEVFPEDQGDYSCVARNSAGEVKTQAKLIVKEASPPPPMPATAPPPKPTSPKKSTATLTLNVQPPVKAKQGPVFIRKLQDQEVVDGARVEMVVEIEGRDPLDVCWLHNDKEIKTNSNVYQLVKQGKTHRLIIPEVFPEDAGVYVCEAYNKEGDDDTSCTLIVTDRPAKPVDIKNGHLVPESHNNHDNIGADNGEDDEFYPPEFIRKPKSQNVDEGNTARFTCQISANPAPRVYWERDGQVIRDEGRFKTQCDGELYVFEISHTLATDEGRYCVVATNTEGTEQLSVSLMVKVLENSDVADFRSLLKNRDGHLKGHHLHTMGAGANEESEKEAEQIDFRGVLIRHVKTKTGVKEGPAETLEIPQLKSVGGGAAMTEAEREADQIDFRGVLTRHVKTKQRPKVVVDLQECFANEGDPVTLACEIEGVPPPKITWYASKKEIKESKYFKMTYINNIARLVIAEVYPEDEGEYICRAVNEAGIVQTSCDITIQELGAACIDEYPRETVVSSSVTEPPFIEDLQPDVVNILRGTPFQLRAKFQGEPRPQVRWYRDKRELRSAGVLKIDVVRDTTTLTVPRAEVDHTGRYTLVVENELGVDSCTSSVTVEDRPNPPARQPAASNITRSSVTLSWYGPSYDGGSMVTCYKLEIRKVAELDWNAVTTDCKDTSFTVTDLEPNTEYLFRVSAANKHGFSEPGKVSEIVVTTERRTSSSSYSREEPGGLGRDLSPYFLAEPLSPAAFKAARDELPFNPRVVTVQPGRSFSDNFNLREEIGRGRFGNVYKCTAKDTGRQYAAKFIRVKPSEREETRLEISIMNQLHHPKLLMLWDAFESQREMVLVMEHVAGGELFERIIDEDYVLTERECVHFMRQICDAVKYMHSCDILHLDLKPENILCITPNSNEVKIIDFGLARNFDPRKNFKVMFGTPEFVAPEVVNYDHVSYSTDIWSVGVICYILLSGLSPFLGEHENETLVNVTMAQWDFDDEGFDEISEHAKNFIEGLLVKDKRKRMTADECLAHRWLSQDVKYMRAKRLSTEKHKRFLARRKWQKTGNAIRALGRMASFQKALTNLGRSGSNDSLLSSRSSLQSSTISETSTPVKSDRSMSGLLRSQKVVPEGTVAGEHDSGIDSKFSEKDSVASSDDGRSTETGSEVSKPGTPDMMGKNSPDSGAVADGTADTPRGDVPQFLRKMKDFDVYEGDSARFEVCVEGEPEPEVKWYKDDTALHESRRILMDCDDSGRYTLIIRHCREEDDAEYTCKAINSAGEVTCSAELYVESPGGS